MFVYLNLYKYDKIFLKKIKDNMKIGIYCKNNQKCNLLRDKLISRLKVLNASFDCTTPDLVIAIGGDGTMLRAIHHYIDRSEEIVFVGINGGHVGYFAEFGDDEFDEFIGYLVTNHLQYNTYHFLEASLNFEHNKKTIYAVNEIRIENPFKTMQSNVYINNELFESFKGNGLCICTALGSTAYNKSIGGAVFSTKIDAIELVEIASIKHNSFSSLGSPLLVSGKDKILLQGNYSSEVGGYDYTTIKENDKLLSIKCFQSKRSEER